MYIAFCLMVMQRYACVKELRRSCPTQIQGKNVILMLRPKVKVIQRSWMYAIQSPMCQIIRNTSGHLWKDGGVPFVWVDYLKEQKSCDPNTKSCQNPIDFTLRSNVNVVSGSWMYATLPLMVLDPCAKYNKLINFKANRSYGSDMMPC